MRKLLLAALAAALIIGATPALAQLAGRWEGTGEGVAYPPCHSPIHPWQIWKGEIPNSLDVFYGEWWDQLGNHGTFKGEIAPFSVPEEVHCEGYWTWYDPNGPSHEPVYGGDFKMTFYILEERCEGTWKSIWPSEPGTMRGWKVE